MATLNLDNKLYDLDKVSPEVRAKVESARFCDRRIAELEAELAVIRTARAAYLSVLPSLVTDDALLKDEAAAKPAAKNRKPSPKKDNTAKH